MWHTFCYIQLLHKDMNYCSIADQLQLAASTPILQEPVILAIVGPIASEEHGVGEGCARTVGNVHQTPAIELHAFR